MIRNRCLDNFNKLCCFLPKLQFPCLVLNSRHIQENHLLSIQSIQSRLPVSVTIYGAFIPTPKSRHENFFKILNLNEICRLGDIHKIKLLLKGSYDVLLLWWGIVLIFFWKKNRFIAMLKIEKIRFFFPSNSTCSKTLHISLS